MDGHQQHPLLKVIEGGEPIEDESEWDGRFMLNAGILIKHLHASSPPSHESTVATDLLDWADRLEAHGRSRLESLGRPALQAVRIAQAAQG